ncbi:hypothetical protein OROMI_027962 [Orobanche minor]
MEEESSCATGLLMVQAIQPMEEVSVIQSMEEGYAMLLIEGESDTTDSDSQKSSQNKSASDEEEPALKKPKIDASEDENPRIDGSEYENARIDESEDEQPGYYYDSSDEEVIEETAHHVKDDNQQGKTNEEDSEEPVILHDDDGNELSDEDLLVLLEGDKRRNRDQKLQLMPKIRRYFKSICESQGYECKDYPGVIDGFTQLHPGQHVINKRERYPEGYNHLMYMSNLALKKYNKETGKDFKVLAVKAATMTQSWGHTHLLTFTARCGEKVETFRARVWDCLEIKVRSYEMVPNSLYSSLPHLSSSDTYVPVAVGDPVKAIEKLQTLSPEKLLSLVQKDHLPPHEKDKLVKKMLKYFDSVVKSQGFKCRCYPGNLPGLPGLKPREKIIHELNRFPEGYSHLKLMARLGLDQYYGPGHVNKVIRVINASMCKESSSSFIYYLTFKSVEKAESILARAAANHDGSVLDDVQTYQLQVK